MRRNLLVATVTTVIALVIAAAAPATVSEVGITLTDHPASCPTNCQAIGQVSGFQSQLGAKKNPYQLHTYGKIVAFTIKLGAPNDQQAQFFNKLFGGPPQVMLTVLKPVPNPKKLPKLKDQYVLAGASPLFDLTNYFGSEPTFALPTPLTTKPNYVIGITVPTWAPAFAVNLADDMQWRSSRDPKACDNVRQNAAHDTRGSVKTYGCLYKTARLLYTATYIPDPKPTSVPPKTKTGTQTTPKTTTQTSPKTTPKTTTQTTPKTTK
jgi:hypothetical protein